MMKQITLHRVQNNWPTYEVDHNGHHYEIEKFPGEQIWNVTVDGTPKDGSYWLKDIKGSILLGDYED